MTTDRSSSLERILLEMEGLQGSQFAEATCRLTGADHFALFTPTREGLQRLSMSSPLPPGALEHLASESLEPGGDPLLFGLCGRLSFVEADLARVPFSDLFPDSTWALLGVGGSWGFSALCFGRGRPSRELAEDRPLAEAFLRRIGAQAGLDASQARLAAEALTRLSHEFKTPLVSIKGYAELILDSADKTLSPRMRDWVRRIAAGANRLAALYRKATSDARTEAAWTYEPRPLVPKQWVQWGVSEASALASERDLEWSWDVKEGLEPVALDPEAGRDLLLELLQNAARATPDGGKVRISLRPEEREGRPGIRLTVEDTGVGVPPGSASDRLFDRFATLVNPMEHHSGDFEFGSGGLGLGLSLVRGVARAHGGEAWVEGKGRDPQALPGCAFHVWLPTFRGEPEPAPPPEVPTRGRLLVADPDPEACGILTEALCESYEVVSACTAREALDRWCSEGPWEGCIVEPRFPEGGGVELIGSLRAHPGAEDTPILAYTTASGPGQATAWRAAGADTCVSKPARVRVLLQRLRVVKARRVRR